MIKILRVREKQKMGRKVLGLDIGIASVGWAVIDLDTSKVVDTGVRLFSEGNPDGNVDRRTFRSGRRMKHRKTTRIADAKELLNSKGIDTQRNESLNPYLMRIKGLNNKLTDEEFSCAYLHLIKRRGSSLENIEGNNYEDEELATKAVLSAHDKAIKSGIFPCQIQFEAAKNNEQIRGEQNNFRTSHYQKELEEILKHQNFDEDFNEKLISLLNRRRKFSEGPGSLKSPTHYGRFIPLPDGSIQEVNLIEKMIGKCSVYPEELRAPKLAPSAEIYNFLNDLNNLTIVMSDEVSRKISKEEKEGILETYIFGTKHGITPIQLAKYLEVDINTIKGFRVDKSNKPLLTTFPGLKSLSKTLINHPYSSNQKVFNELSEILTREKSKEERIEKIQQVYSKILSKTEIEELSLLKGFTGYHSLSFKIMNEVYDEQVNTEQNFMQIMMQKEMLNKVDKNLKGKKNIPTSAENIYSPVARRSVTQALKIVNRAREIYGEFDRIVIEMPRDRNSQEQKKRISLEQKKNDSRNRMIEEIGGENLRGNQRLKISLYLEQDGKCLYTGKPIDLRLLLSDDTAYEIDHIIPLSISFDDSYQNKVLVTRSANQIKGQRSPYEAFATGGMGGWDKNSFYTYIFNILKNDTKYAKKFNYLTFEEPTNSIDTLKRFINRNLVDTQYSSRAVLNTLQSYFKANAINTKILTVRGAVTNQFRKKIKLPKDREEDFSHHAVDAAIIALLSKKSDVYQFMSHGSMVEGQFTLDESLKDSFEQKSYFDSDYLAMISQVRNLDTFKYSHKVDRKPNRKVSDDTIYSTRIRNVEGKESEYVVKKYKDIYGGEGISLAKKILEGKGDMLLMYHHDIKTYEFLEEIVRDYVLQNGPIKNESPFMFFKNQHGPVRKYSKKENGPEIKSVKYYDSKLGNHIDITNRDQVDDNKRRVILLQISPYRTDVYLRTDGTYGFVTVRYSNIKYKDSLGKYVIDPDWYETEKAKKKLNDAQFMFSMHRGEVLRIVKDDKNGIEDNLWRFTATNDDIANKIEVKPISHYNSKRNKPTIGKNVKLLEKYNQDVLGNLYKADQEVLKLEFK